MLSTLTGSTYITVTNNAGGINISATGLQPSGAYLLASKDALTNYYDKTASYARYQPAFTLANYTTKAVADTLYQPIGAYLLSSTDALTNYYDHTASDARYQPAFIR